MDHTNSYMLNINIRDEYVLFLVQPNPMEGVLLIFERVPSLFYLLLEARGFYGFSF